MKSLCLLFVLSVMAVVACGPAEQTQAPAVGNQLSCGQGTTQVGDKCEVAAQGGAAGASVGGADGSPAAGGSPSAGGAGGAPASGGSPAQGGAGGYVVVGGSGGSPSTGGSPAQGGSGGAQCVVSPNGVTISVAITFEGNDFPVVIYNDFDNSPNGWFAKAQTFTANDVVVADLATPGLHRLQGALYGGDYLVRGLPSVMLTVPESSVRVRFDCGAWQSPIQLPAGKTVVMTAYSVAYGWVAGEQGPNLLFCNSAAGCAVTLAP